MSRVEPLNISDEQVQQETNDYRDTDVLFECGCNIKHRWSTGMDFYYCGKHNLSMKVKPLE